MIMYSCDGGNNDNAGSFLKKQINKEDNGNSAMAIMVVVWPHQWWSWIHDDKNGYAFTDVVNHINE